MPTETRNRRSYTEEFKRDAVALVTEQIRTRERFQAEYIEQERPSLTLSVMRTEASS
jgi:hypothetical protein